MRASLLQGTITCRASRQPVTSSRPPTCMRLGLRSIDEARRFSDGGKEAAQRSVCLGAKALCFCRKSSKTFRSTASMPMSSIRSTLSQTTAMSLEQSKEPWPSKSRASPGVSSSTWVPCATAFVEGSTPALILAPLLLASLRRSASSMICSEASFVGAMMRIEGRAAGSRAPSRVPVSILLKVGSRYASVFPDRGGAMATASWPSIAKGQRYC
mmetsp:Transcript_11152/g.25570  ORF Transcript_11152/g.25570 Transcript_11152/m.25570 type:complete len:213 (+) Transcript_11152:755-1393(+)